MTEDKYNIRRGQIESHIQLLEERYPAEQERREAVGNLEGLLENLDELESIPRAA